MKKYIRLSLDIILVCLLAYNVIVVINRIKKEHKEIIIPEKSGTFKYESPKPFKVFEPVSFEIEEFKKLPEPEKVKKYAKDTQKREYTKIFKDSVQEITVKATTNGYLNDLQIDYKIPKASLTVPVSPKYRFKPSLYVGIQAETSNIFNNLQINTHFVFKKVLYLYSYSITSNTHSIGVSIKVF